MLRPSTCTLETPQRVNKTEEELFVPKPVRRWHHRQQNIYAPWPKHRSPNPVVEGPFVFILRHVHRVRHRPKRCGSAAQRNTHTSTRHPGGHHAHAAHRRVSPRAAHNAMVQWMLLREDERELEMLPTGAGAKQRRHAKGRM